MNLSSLKKIKIPDKPGVYLFKGNHGQILYVGKATTLKERVKSYFGKDLEFARGPVVKKMVESSKTLSWIETDSVLEAYILETNLIKKYQPKANVQQKDDKSFNYIVITKEEYPRVLLVRGKDIPKNYPLNKRLYAIGPFPQGGVLKDGLKIIRKIFPFRDRCTPELGKPCFNRQLGLCPGVCTGEVEKSEYRKTIKNLIRFFEGGKQEVIKNLEKEMKVYAKSREFEKANSVKRTIFALNHIQDISLIKEEFSPSEKNGFRIESYDIAHLGGKEMVGVMVVMEDGKPKKSDYRKFKIRKFDQSNDTGALNEVLTRRLGHFEWPPPQLIVVDGGIAQKNAVEKVLTERNFNIEVVAVRKNERHKPEELMGKKGIIEKYEKNILLSNSEAHRFAITYHKNLRRRGFIKR